jgi:hypothetical protein
VQCGFNNVARGNVVEHVRNVRLDGVVVNGRRVESLT